MVLRRAPETRHLQGARLVNLWASGARRRAASLPVHQSRLTGTDSSLAALDSPSSAVMTCAEVLRADVAVHAVLDGEGLSRCLLQKNTEDHRPCVLFDRVKA